MKYTEGGNVDTDASLSITSSDLLDNGIKATANLDILNGYDNSSVAGTVSLSSETIGTFTAGEIDADNAFQLGDVTDLYSNTQDIDEDSIKIQGAHYERKMGNLHVAMQFNSSTDASGLVSSSDNVQKGKQFSAVYDMDNLKIGAAWISDSAANLNTKNLDKAEGILKDTSIIGLSYDLGDFTIKMGKEKERDISGALVYTVNFDDVALEASAIFDQDDTGYKVIASYTMNNIAIKVTSETNVDDIIRAEYKSGGLMFAIDNDRKITASLDFGKADLIMEREKDQTSLTYKVSF
jgi:hypothetical protein